MSAEASSIQAAICRALGGQPDAIVSAGKFASDAEMSGNGGDPLVTFDPKGFRGEGPGGKGRRYSQCSWQFLEFWAETLDYMAANPKEGKEKYVRGNMADARKARTWAKRIRGGWSPESEGTPPSQPDDGWSSQ